MLNIEKAENGFIIRENIHSKMFIFSSLAEALLSVAEFFHEYENIVVDMFTIQKNERELEKNNDD